MIKHTEKKTEYPAYAVFGDPYEPVPFWDSNNSRQKDRCLAPSTLKPIPTGHSTQAQGQCGAGGTDFYFR